MASTIMTVTLIFLVSLHVMTCGSPGNYYPRDFGHPDPADVPLGSITRYCFHIMGTQCGAFNTSPSVCAYFGVLHWTTTGNNVPGYVIEYYNMFRENLVAANLRLPNQFCEAQHESRRDICKIQLMEFQAKVRDAGCGNRFEIEQQSRQDILLFAFYERRQSMYERRHFARDYLSEIANNTHVRYGSMINPEQYCRIKFPLGYN